MPPSAPLRSSPPPRTPALSLRRKLAFAALTQVLLLGLVELGLRVGVSIEGSPLRQPRLFAHPRIGEDHWRLHARWGGRWSVSPERVHPLLGWSQTVVDADNPLGLLPETRAALLAPGRPKVLFYGDSYVAGECAAESWIPRIMDRALPERDVVHLGVGGYGLGQIHLLFRETHCMVPRPVVLMGVMLDDLDRSVQSVRTALKPRYRLGPDGELVLGGVPIPRDQHRRILEQPLDLRSWTWAMVRARARVDDRIPEKRAVNRAILAETRRQVQGAEGRLVVVVFHTLWSLRGEDGDEDWRGPYLRETLDELGIDSVDTRPLLLEAARRQDVPLEHFYVGGGGHHDADGNAVIAEALVSKLRALGD